VSPSAIRTWLRARRARLFVLERSGVALGLGLYARLQIRRAMEPHMTGERDKAIREPNADVHIHGRDCDHRPVTGLASVCSWRGAGGRSEGRCMLELRGIGPPCQFGRYQGDRVPAYQGPRSHCKGEG
jgi:hypothetical protein